MQARIDFLHSVHGPNPFARHKDCHNWILLATVEGVESASWARWRHVEVLDDEGEGNAPEEEHKLIVALLNVCGRTN
jgi:hypothetical protein